MKQNRILARRVSRLTVAALAVSLLAGCGSKDKDEEADNIPQRPVEELYNNGVDALNTHRYDSASMNCHCNGMI